MTEVPFLDLKAQYKSIKSEINKAIGRVLESQHFVLGSELEEFEKEFADYIGVKYAVGVNSGTDGLILALISLGVGKGDEVITPANSFIATTSAIVQAGATPVLVDCDPDTYQIDIKQVEKKITKKTKAIIPVHLYGAPARIDELVRISRKHNLFLIEDAAQAHGASLNGKKMGSFGDIAAFSFYPGKNLGAYGDAGAVVTDNAKLYERLIRLRNHGQTKKYFHQELGFNSRLDDIQAAVLRVKLRHLDNWNKKRNIIAKTYNNKLKKYKTQKIIEGSISSYHLFVIESSNREKLSAYLLENGIHTQIHYPIPIHLQNAHKSLGYKKGDFPHTEKAAERILSIPMYPELTSRQLKNIINFLNRFSI